MTQRRNDLYEELARLRGIEFKTYDECATILRQSARTLRRWAQTEEYQTFLESLRKEWRKDASTAVEGIAREAISVLRSLIHDPTVRPHVRFEAAAKLGDWAGLGVKQAETEQDDREALMELYRILEQPRVVVTLAPGSTVVSSTPMLMQPEDILEGEILER